jgi:hypothetical protein
MVFLAGYPCSDNNTCTDDKKNDQEIAFSISQHSPEEAEADLCSPFCICNCCRMHINEPGYFSLAFHVPNFTEKQSFSEIHSIPSIPHTIWQPPKIV